MSTQPSPEETPKADAPKKSRKGLILVIAIVAFLVVAGGGAGAFLMMRSEGAATAEEGQQEQAAEQKEYLVSLETFVVNLADPGGNRYLKATIRAVTHNAALEERIVNDDILRSRVRNRILTILSSKTYDAVGTPVGKEALRREIVREVNKLLGSEDVEDILFVEFIVQ